MIESLLDDATVDALIVGDLVPGRVPPGLEQVALLTRAARSPGAPSETEVPESLLALLTGIATANAESHPAGRTPSRSFGARRRAVVLAGALLLTGTGVAAAATNTLPAVIRDAVADDAERVGLDRSRPERSEPTSPERSDPLGPLRPTGQQPASSETPAAATTATTPVPAGRPGPTCSRSPGPGACDDGIGPFDRYPDPSEIRPSGESGEPPTATTGPPPPTISPGNRTDNDVAPPVTPDHPPTPPATTIGARPAVAPQVAPPPAPTEPAPADLPGRARP